MLNFWFATSSKAIKRGLWIKVFVFLILMFRNEHLYFHLMAHIKCMNYSVFLYITNEWISIIFYQPYSYENLIIDKEATVEIGWSTYFLDLDADTPVVLELPFP